MRTSRLAILALGAAILLSAAQVSAAPRDTTEPQRFSSPEQAVDALVAAARAGDRKKVMAILGPGSQELISSGDTVEDAYTRQQFIAAYDDKHSIESDGDKPAILVVGPDAWPFPIPLVQQDGAWRFDTAAGREEILARRIGRNEAAVVKSCLAFYDAQNEYADLNRDRNGMAVYAQRIVSSPGKKDGLYWPTAQGEQQSPLGEAVAAATGRGYRVGAQAPFHGYYFKVLTRQGPTAPGGAVNYVVGGSMIGGFALVAYPAQYGNSGIMTFLVNNDGDVFQKDLGPQTAQLAARMSSFDPDHTWKKVVETEEEK
jgi:hypothetical protein